MKTKEKKTHRQVKLCEINEVSEVKDETVLF